MQGQPKRAALLAKYDSIDAVTGDVRRERKAAMTLGASGLPPVLMLSSLHFSGHSIPL